MKVKPFVKRLISTTILLPFGIFVVFSPWLNGIPILILLTAFVLLIAFEISQMMEKRGYNSHIWVNSTAVTLSMVNFYLYGLGVFDIGYFFLIEMSILIVFLLTIFLLEGGRGEFGNSVEVIGVSIFTFVFVGVFAPMILLLKMMDLSGWFLAILLITAWLTDTGGLVIGKWLGKRRIPFLASPNKTVEGYIGTFIFGQITVIALFFAQRIFSIGTDFSIFEFMLIGVLISIASNIGDLGESTFKRWAKVKDSGDLLPGLGGFFDMMDSVIASAPVLYILLRFFGY
jgi:phosphatidate cytidylyltransferase